MLKTECLPVHGRHFSAVTVGIESQLGITDVSHEAQVWCQGFTCAEPACPKAVPLLWPLQISCDSCEPVPC